MFPLLIKTPFHQNDAVHCHYLVGRVPGPLWSYPVAGVVWVVRIVFRLLGTRCRQQGENGNYSDLCQCFIHSFHLLNDGGITPQSFRARHVWQVVIRTTDSHSARYDPLRSRSRFRFHGEVHVVCRRRSKQSQRMEEACFRIDRTSFML